MFEEIAYALLHLQPLAFRIQRECGRIWLQQNEALVCGLASKRGRQGHTPLLIQLIEVASKKLPQSTTWLHCTTILKDCELGFGVYSGIHFSPPFPT